MKREVGVSRMPRGLRQTARSISFLSPTDSCPVAFLAMKMRRSSCGPSANYSI